MLTEFDRTYGSELARVASSPQVDDNTSEWDGIYRAAATYCKIRKAQTPGFDRNAFLDLVGVPPENITDDAIFV